MKVVYLVLSVPVVFQICCCSRAKASSFSDVKEYCEWESFNVSCPHPDHVIIIGSAKYGRMRLGKCVTKNYGHVGCGTDVTSYFDQMCSGRHSCVIGVIALHERMSCPADFKSYLEASYDCVKVLTPVNMSTCNANNSGDVNYRFIDDTPSGLLASVTTRETGVGSESCPWIIRVQPHQRINITLFDYSDSSTPSADGYNDPLAASSECIEYAVITERLDAAVVNTTVCGRRLRNYVSETNTVEVKLKSSAAENKYFLLKYEAFGCVPIAAPTGAWVSNSGRMAVVRCNDTGETWRLTCRGVLWDSQPGNCSIILPILQKPEDWMNENNFPLGILVVVALGVLIGVAAGVLMLLGVLAYMRRRRIRKIRSRSNYILDDQCGSSNGHRLHHCSSMDSKKGDHRTPIYKANPNGSSGDLLHGTWQRTRPLPNPIVNDSMQPSDDVIPLTPMTATTEVPLLQSIDTPPIGGIVFSTLGAGNYHEQCIDMLRRSNNSNRIPAGSPAIFTGYCSNQRDQGPYYFKLDSAGFGSRDQRPDMIPQCVMCQPRSPSSYPGMLDGSYHSDNPF